jgi:hypothetical protein
MLAILLVLFGAVMRLLPHLPNFAPIAAMALFGGVYLRQRYALLLPLLAVALSDVALGFDSVQGRLTVYGSFLLIGVLGLLIRNKKNFWTIAAGSLGGSVLFYLVTNFAYFYPDTMYPHTWSGVLASYTNALPFFRNTLMGDMFYAALLFGAYELMMYVAAARTRRSEEVYAS